MSRGDVQLLIDILTISIFPFCVGLAIFITWLGIRWDTRQLIASKEQEAREKCMALSNEPVYFCDPHQKSGKRVLGDHYVIHFEGPGEERTTYAVDVCAVQEWGKLGHDQAIQTLVSFLKEHGTVVHGAELILPENRKIISPVKVYHPELTPRVEGQEDAPRVPLPPFSNPDEPPAAPPAPPPVVSPFSGQAQPVEDPKESPEGDEGDGENLPTFYSWLHHWGEKRGMTIADLAHKMGYASPGTLYRWKTNPPAETKMFRALGSLGVPLSEAKRVTQRYSDAPDDPTPGLDDVIQSKINEAPEDPKPRIPRAVTSGERAGGLHRASIYGEGQTRGSNPILGIA